MRRAKLLFFIGLFFNMSFLQAQPGDPGGGGNPTPISGIEILLVGGAALGVKRLYSKNKKRD